MKMNSYRRNKARDPNDTALFVAFIAILLLALFVFGIDRLSGGAVRGTARQGGAALWAAAAGAYESAVGTGAFSSKRALAEENRALKDALAARTQELARFQALADENEALRGMARLAQTDAGITVPVLSSFESSPYGTFTVGGGAAAGMEEGSLVLTEGGFVLGSVTSVAPRAATVEAFFAPGKKISMQVAGVAFESEGRGGGNARGEVPRDAMVKKNDVVTVPAFGGRPAALIGEVQAASSSPFATLYVRIPVNLTTLRYVYVLPLP